MEKHKFHTDINILSNICISLYKYATKEYSANELMQFSKSFLSNQILSQNIRLQEPILLLSSILLKQESMPLIIKNILKNNPDKIKHFVDNIDKTIDFYANIIYLSIDANQIPISLNTEKVASYLDTNTIMILNLIKSGELPAFKMGNQYRVEQKSLNAYIISHRFTNFKEKESFQEKHKKEKTTNNNNKQASTTIDKKDTQPAVHMEDSSKKQEKHDPQETKDITHNPQKTKAPRQFSQNQNQSQEPKRQQENKDNQQKQPQQKQRQPQNQNQNQTQGKRGKDKPVTIIKPPTPISSDRKRDKEIPTLTLKREETAKDHVPEPIKISRNTEKEPSSTKENSSKIQDLNTKSESTTRKPKEFHDVKESDKDKEVDIPDIFIPLPPEPEQEEMTSMEDDSKKMEEEDLTIPSITPSESDQEESDELKKNKDLNDGSPNNLKESPKTKEKTHTKIEDKEDEPKDFPSFSLDEPDSITKEKNPTSNKENEEEQGFIMLGDDNPIDVSVPVKKGKDMEEDEFSMDIQADSSTVENDFPSKIDSSAGKSTKPKITVHKDKNSEEIS